MKKFSKEIERLADEEIKEYGYTRADFTEEELQELMEEIRDRKEHPDAMILDGFWEMNNDCFRRERKMLEELELKETVLNIIDKDNDTNK